MAIFLFTVVFFFLLTNLNQKFGTKIQLLNLWNEIYIIRLLLIVFFSLVIQLHNIYVNINVLAYLNYFVINYVYCTFQKSYTQSTFSRIHNAIKRIIFIDVVVKFINSLLVNDNKILLIEKIKGVQRKEN